MVDISLMVWGGGLALLGLLVGLMLVIFSKKRRNKRIQHYERIRDELTLRKPKIKKIVKEAEEIEHTSGGLPIGSLIPGFIVILVGLSILPTISEELEQAINTTNTTGNMPSTVPIMLDLLPMFFVIVIASAIISVAAQGLRSSRLVGYEEELKKEVKGRIEHYEDIRDELTTRGIKLTGG